MRRLFLILLVPLVLVGCASPRLPCSVEYGDADGWQLRDGAVIVLLHRGWKWEPCIYQAGAVITLHALARDRDPAGDIEAAGLPAWTRWNPDPDNKRSATMQQARLEGTLRREWTFQDSAPGWPTHLYR